MLAGHSLGACYARRYAQLFPGEVAGLLLLDPGHEDMFSYLPPSAAERNEQSVTRGEHRELPAASHQHLHIEQQGAAGTALRDLLAMTSRPPA